MVQLVELHIFFWNVGHPPCGPAVLPRPRPEALLTTKSNAPDVQFDVKIDFISANLPEPSRGFNIGLPIIAAWVHGSKPPQVQPDPVSGPYASERIFLTPLATTGIMPM